MKKDRPQGRSHDHNAVTALLSTILLLAIAISLVTLIYSAVLTSTTEHTEDKASTTNLAASVVHNNISFMNSGGDALSPDTKITITINQMPYTFTVGSLTGGKSWQPGQEIICHPPGNPTLNGLQVDYSILNPDTNMVLMHGIIQEGESGDTPYVQTIGASQITSHSARLTLNYNFINPHTNQQVRIQYKTDSITSQYDQNAVWTNITNTTTSGTFNLDVHNLLAGQRYVFRSQLLYQGITVPKQGLGLTFTTPSDHIGEWNFDSTSGTVIDSASNNHGSLQPDDRRGPRYGPGYVLNALRFDGIDDKVNIPNANNLNVVDEMTFETWVKPLNWSNGSAAGFTQTSSSQFFGGYGCFEPDWISLGGEYYAIVSRASNQTGYLVTVQIANGGTIYSNASTCIINKAVISTTCLTPKIIAVNGMPGVYAIVFTGPSAFGYVRTISISGTGIIGAWMTNFGFTNPRLCYHPDIAFVSGSTYAIVYSTSTTATSSYGYVQCISITAGGATVALKGAVFSMTHDAIPAYLTGQQVLVQEPEILELQQGSAFHYFAIAYKCRDDDGGLYTVQISPATGTVTRITGERKFDSKRGENPEIFFLTGRYYGIVYGCEGGSLPYNDDLNHLRGWVTIVKINELTGVISYHGEEADHFVNGNAYGFNNREYGSAYTAYTFRNPQALYVSSGSGKYTFLFSYVLKSTTGGITTTRGYVHTLQIKPQSPYSQFTEIANFSYDASTPEAPDIIQMGSSTTYAVVGRIATSGTNNNGLIKTLTVANDGSIAAKPILDSKILGVSYCSRIDLMRVSNTYAVALIQGQNNSGFLKTFYLPPSGALPQYYNDSLALELGVGMGSDPYQACYEPYMFHMYSNYYGIVYRNYTSRLTLAVVQIDGTGHITAAYKRSLSGIQCIAQQSAVAMDECTDVYLVAYRESTGRGKLLTVKLTPTSCCMLANATLDASTCTEPLVYRIGSGYYAVTYCGVSSKGELKTFLISSGGTVVSFVDEYVFTDTVKWCSHPGMAPVNATLFAVTYSRYEGSRYSSVVFTVKIRGNGTIQKSNIDNLTFNYPTTASSQSSVATNPSILRMNTRVYLLTYKNNQLGCGLASIRIGETGNITDATDNTYVTAGVDSYHLSMIPMNGDMYLVGTGTVLMVRSMKNSLSLVSRNIFSKAGSYALYANATHVTARIDDTAVGHILTVPLSYPNNWNYIVVTYKVGRYMNLSVNANESASNGHFACSAESGSNHLLQIKVTSSPLYFGEYSGWFDEFSMWGTAFSPSWISNRFHNPNG